jgi:hypothetical protein
MPQLTVSVSQDVADALARQARALLLGRQQYVRSLLAAAAMTSDSAAPAVVNQQPNGSTPTNGIARRHGVNCCCWDYRASLPAITVAALDRQAQQLFLSRGLYVDGLLSAVAHVGNHVAKDAPALASARALEVA